MATTFKTFSSNDITSTRTLLHEAIPITGTLVSGTYGTYPTGTHIKDHSHGMYQSVYDYPYLSSSANHIFDITFGYASASALSGAASKQNSKKINIYNTFAQVLNGVDVTGNVKPFKLPGGNPIYEALFLTFSRLLVKDEIKKGSFSLTLATGSVFRGANFFTELKQYTDNNAQNSFYTDSPAGEYAIITASHIAGAAAGVRGDAADVGVDSAGSGLLYYQAGVLVLSASHDQVRIMTGSNATIGGRTDDGSKVGTFLMFASGSNISSSTNAFRHRIQEVSFNNTTELNSTIHFCRASHNDFNYSANPTYLSESRIRVKNSSLDQPVSYITSVGLYSSDNELLAVAKLSEPIKKSPDTELTMRVRLDY